MSHEEGMLSLDDLRRCVAEGGRNPGPEPNPGGGTDGLPRKYELWRMLTTRS